MPSTLTAPVGGTFRNNDGPLEWFQEGSSAAFRQNDPVILDSAEQIQIACAAGASLANSQLVVGHVTSKATGVQGTKHGVVLLTNQFRWLIPIYHSTPASAVTSQDHVGKYIPLSNVGGIWVANISGGAPDATLDAGDHVQVLAIDTRYAVGTQYGLYWVTYPPSRRLFA